MEIDVYRMYQGKPLPRRGLKVKFDRYSRKRPAWIEVRGLPENTFLISTRIHNRIILYKIYLSPKIPLFLPVDYTKEEMKIFYDKFSEVYDRYIKRNNIKAAEFLLSKLKLSKDAKILDLGAGTGLGSIPLIRRGYKNITLLEYSRKMLAKAKKKKELKKCKFICSDIGRMNLKEKFDLIISNFSLGLSAYFREEDMPALWKKVSGYMKQDGVLALMGHEYSPPKKLFRKLKTGKYKVIDGYSAEWFIGKKR